MVETLLPQTAKSRRLSLVSLSAAVMAVVWYVLDTWTDFYIDPVGVSLITSLVMLISGFYDLRAKDAGAELYHGDDE